jgi:Rieske Fe-S protein
MQDAWTTYADETIGRVWLVRRTDDTTPADDSHVEAFTSVCPHLGCAIQFPGPGKFFVCPCHKAAFDLSGQPVSDKVLGRVNHAPRGLDRLDCRLVQEEESGEWWVEVKYEKFEPGLTKQVAKS